MTRQTLVLSLPESFPGKTGLSFDIGGSLIKVAFCRTDTVSEETKFTFESFPTNNVEEAIAFCLKECPDVLNSEKPPYTCGVGIDKFEKVLCEKLKIQKLINVSELDCFAEGFSLLYQHLAIEDFCYPESQVARDYCERQKQEWERMLDGREKIKETIGEDDSKSNWEDKSGLWSSEEQKEAENVSPAKYPVILALLGSGAGALMIKGDAKYTFEEANTRCGRTFLGLGSLLTGEKTFEGLVGLAEKGDINNLLVSGMHLKAKSESNMYSVIPDHMPLYSFGHAVGKNIDDFKKEDLALSVLDTIAQDIACSMYNCTSCTGVNNIYFCGSFCGSSQKVRDEIAKYFLAKGLNNPTGKVECRFLRYGAYMGAFGALLRTLRSKEEK